MAQSVLDRVVEGLRQRREQFAQWWSESSDAEKSLRLGPRPQAAADRTLSVLDSALKKCTASELGRCIVCHETVEDHLLEMDFNASVCLSHLSGEERSRLENELELSQKVQRALLPQKAPELPGWDIAAFSQPASIVGGDYFDFLRFADGAHGILIADVMGKGMPASMLMANLQASIRILVADYDSPADVLTRLNRLFHRNISMTKFVTLFLGKLDTATGMLRYVNAGHHPALLRHAAGGSCELLAPTGPAIGILDEPSLDIKTAAMETGDTLILYTDGIVEARNPAGTEFGAEQLQAAAFSSGETSAAAIVRDIRGRLQSFVAAAPVHDDTTLVVYRRNNA